MGLHTDRGNLNDSQTLISDEDLYKSIVVLDESDENFNKIQEVLSDGASPHSRMQSYLSQSLHQVLRTKNDLVNY